MRIPIVALGPMEIVEIEKLIHSLIERWLWRNPQEFERGTIKINLHFGEGNHRCLVGFSRDGKTVGSMINTTFPEGMKQDDFADLVACRLGQLALVTTSGRCNIISREAFPSIRSIEIGMG